MEINVDDILGPRYVGRRYLRYADLVALGIVGNRGSLALWIRKGQFPAGIKIAGPYGRTLVWPAVEVAQHLVNRSAKRPSPAAHPGRARVAIAGTAEVSVRQAGEDNVLPAPPRLANR